MHDEYEDYDFEDTRIAKFVIVVVKSGTSQIRAEKGVFQRDGFPVIVLGCFEKGLRIAEGRTTETDETRGRKHRS